MGAETELIVRTAPLIMLVALLTGTVGAFSISPGGTCCARTHSVRSNNIESKRNNRSQNNSKRMRSISTLHMASSDGDGDGDGDGNDESNQSSQEDKLAALGYSSTEISRSQSKGDDATPRPGEQEVFVEEFEVDAATLTAVGFGLIAFNFLVLANMGDGGIGGVVASFINSNRY
eukprot:CAMPEP_0181021618 /NCGR_PEP_ID=MMETSP1070-20121207/1075_1 /TAXON_ID=265543 /ORGANISM="Minutocellus polymorphus, Strain NH13" /LENGTH=174 /DNA_ID=CAMNT_0023098501 /DNA_START=266 /DNA_END=790 /DNA_ORIENTATION=+